MSRLPRHISLLNKPGVLHSISKYIDFNWLLSSPVQWAVFCKGEKKPHPRVVILNMDWPNIISPVLSEWLPKPPPVAG